MFWKNPAYMCGRNQLKKISFEQSGLGCILMLDFAELSKLWSNLESVLREHVFVCHLRSEFGAIRNIRDDSGSDEFSPAPWLMHFAWNPQMWDKERTNCLQFQTTKYTDSRYWAKHFWEFLILATVWIGELQVHRIWIKNRNNATRILFCCLPIAGLAEWKSDIILCS